MTVFVAVSVVRMLVSVHHWSGLMITEGEKQCLLIERKVNLADHLRTRRGVLSIVTAHPHGNADTDEDQC